jgi:hypothetical protein
MYSWLKAGSLKKKPARWGFLWVALLQINKCHTTDAKIRLPLSGITSNHKIEAFVDNSQNHQGSHGCINHTYPLRFQAMGTSSQPI